MKPAVLALALSLVVPAALAASEQSEWKEGSFRELSDWSFEGAGVRFSNCHIVQVDLGGLQAAPKCYVLNRGNAPARVKVRFVALDKAGASVIDTTIASFAELQPGVGTELSQFLPITPEEWGRIDRGKIQAWAATK